MLRKLTVLVLALTLGAAPLGAQQDVTPEQVEALKERIADIDRWLADRDFVTREEFDAVRAMAQKAREENEALKARLDALESAKK